MILNFEKLELIQKLEDFYGKSLFVWSDQESALF